MMKFSRTSGALALGLVLAVQWGCGPSLVVNTDWNPALGPQMGQWRTFAWLDHHDDDEPYEGLDEGRIRDAIARNLVSKGYTLVRDEASADFRVAHHLSIERHFAVHSPTYYGGWYGWYDPFYGPWYDPGYGYSPGYVSEWETGVLVVDFVDAATNELAWRGVAESAPLGRMESPDRRQAILQQAVDEMLQAFPAVGQRMPAPAVSSR